MIAAKFITLGRDVDPKAAMTADGRGALNGKTNRHRLVRPGREIDVFTLHLR